MRKLYLLTRIDVVGYDQLSAVVIRANSQKSARSYAAIYAGDEGPDFWKDKTKTTCEILTAENGDSGYVIKDYRAA